MALVEPIDVQYLVMARLRRSRENEMRNREMKRMKVSLSKLTLGQRKTLSVELAALEMQPVSTNIIENRFSQVTACPHCSGERIVKNGNARGLQRYKCRACGKTFCALTGTPLAGLHMRGKWLGQAEALDAGLTLHEVADKLDIAVSTAFLWRHRFLQLPKSVMAKKLVGIAEADETFFLRSNKGQKRGLNRAPRKRGGKAKKRGVSNEQVPVLVARDRAGNTADFILEAVDKLHVWIALTPLLAQDSILCTDGSKALTAVAESIGVTHHPVNLSAGVRVDGPWHVQNVNAYHSRLKGWMRRFKGVATRYLDSYLGWFRAIDRSRESTLKPAQWLAMAVGG
jgi:transposase-like protein